MLNTTLKMALAALIHDIGKFAQGSLELTNEYIINNAQLYQPFYNGHYTHVHVLYTAAFIEQMADYLPSVCTKGTWGEGDSFINLAAGHHNPKTPMQWIITEADRISSGLDRDIFKDGDKISYKDFKKTRLLPILESLGPDRCKNFKIKHNYKYSYPLKPISASSIFPIERNKQEKINPEEEYKELFFEFSDKLKGLYHKSNISLWIQHFNSLLMSYTSLIPAARVEDVVHDVSLYDHCHTTAALASALYQYHARTKNFDISEIKNRDTEKLLLISGDFYGIQNFIFKTHSISKKFRSKLIRGRSLAVSILVDLAARLICERLQLSTLSIILSSAGKFHILAPNTDEVISIIEECKKAITDWFFSYTYGENNITIAYTKASPAQFQAGEFQSLWLKHLQEMEQKKFQKIDLDVYGGAVPFNKFLDKFDTMLNPSLCPLCGMRPSDKRTQNDNILEDIGCSFCRDNIFLGTNVVKNNLIAICKKNFSKKVENKLFIPFFNEFQLFFTDNPLDELANSGDLLDLWEINISEDGTFPCRATIKFFNGHVPCYREEDKNDEELLNSLKSDEQKDPIKVGSIKSFSYIALKAKKKEGDRYKGLEALGILKADIDNLAMLFGCGFETKRYTISRISTLSRQLNFFFSLYLPHFLANSPQFYNTYTVFAGGDDLFLIGPWNSMLDLAELLNAKFHSFTCNNPDITISAGITIHKANTPINIMAKQAEEALRQVKDKNKNAISIFNQIITWYNYSKLLKLRNILKKWLKHNYISKVICYKFNKIIDMVEEEYNIKYESNITIDKLNCFKWKSLFYYLIIRNVPNNDEIINEICQMISWLEEYRTALRIPLWSLLYEERK